MMNRNLALVGLALLAFMAPLIFLAVTGHALSRNLALTLIFIVCVMGPAVAIGLTGFSSIGALGRNPSAAPKILTAMTISLIAIEGIAIVAFLIVWQLFSRE